MLEREETLGREQIFVNGLKQQLQLGVTVKFCVVGSCARCARVQLNCALCQCDHGVHVSMQQTPQTLVYSPAFVCSLHLFTVNQENGFVSQHAASCSPAGLASKHNIREPPL